MPVTLICPGCGNPHLIPLPGDMEDGRVITHVAIGMLPPHGCLSAEIYTGDTGMDITLERSEMFKARYGDHNDYLETPPPPRRRPPPTILGPLPPHSRRRTRRQL